MHKPRGGKSSNSLVMGFQDVHMCTCPKDTIYSDTPHSHLSPGHPHVHQSLMVSFIYLLRLFSFLTSLIFQLSPYLFTPFLWNIFCLNAASLLHVVHGSIIPFPLTLYGHLLSFMRCLNTASPLLLHSLAFLLYLSGLLYHKHCLVHAPHAHLFKQRYFMYSL